MQPAAVGTIFFRASVLAVELLLLAASAAPRASPSLAGLLALFVLNHVDMEQ